MAADPGYRPKATAAAEPAQPSMIPHIVVQTRLGEVDGDYEEALDEALQRFGFHPKHTELRVDELGDQSDIVQYHAEDITFNGNPNDAIKHFAALLKHMYANQRRLGLDLDPSLIQRHLQEFKEQAHTQYKFHGHTSPGSVYVDAAAEPGHDATKTLKVLSFRFLLPRHSSVYNTALIKAHAFIAHTLTKYGIEHSKVLDRAGDVHGVDTREDGDAGTDVTTFEIHDVAASTTALLAFAVAIGKHGDFYGDEHEFVSAVRRGSTSVHASAADHKKFSHAHRLFHALVGWTRSGRNLGAIAENRLRDKFNGTEYVATFGVSTKLDLMAPSRTWKVYLNLVADASTSGYQITLPETGELAVVRMGTKSETFHVHVPESEDEPHELARVIVEECLKHLPKKAVASAAPTKSWLGLVIETELVIGSKADVPATRSRIIADVVASIADANFTADSVSPATAGRRFVVSVKGLRPPFQEADDSVLSKWLQRLHQAIANSVTLRRYGVGKFLKSTRAFVHDMLRTLEIKSPVPVTAGAAVVMPAVGVIDCYRRLLTALAMRYHRTKFSVAPDIHAVVGTGNVRPYGQMRVLQLSSDYTDATCSVYPDTADGVIVEIGGVKHPLPLADCAAPAALLREIVHMYRDKARKTATAAFDAEIAELESMLVTAAAEPEPAPADGAYVHAIDGKVRGLLQLMTKWTASEKNVQGKEDMRQILIALKKMCWPRLSEDSRKKLLELK